MYPVADIFRSLQGEGHFVGYPMVFVRLAGCSVGACHIRKECDEAPWKARWTISASEIVERAHHLQPNGIVCITGGEPTDHDLLPLIGAFRDAGWRVHLETSGSRSVAGYPLEWLTVSPKILDAPLVQRSGHTLKMVVRHDWPNEQAWELINAIDRDTQFFHRYLQPLTIGGATSNLEMVVAMVLDKQRNVDGRWALSTQAHRVWRLK